MIFGVDCASSVTTPNRLKDSDVGFVCRYLSPPGNGKNITKAEAETITKAGLGIVVVWEENGDEPIVGHSSTGVGAPAGVQDARLAEAEAAAAGMPKGSPIYFALDRDPNALSAAEWAAVYGYFKGVRSVLGAHRVGAYGGYLLVKNLFDRKLIDYGWQTYAWSNKQWDPRARLRQYLNAQELGGIGVDFDHALDADYGQWRTAPLKPPIDHYHITFRDKQGRIRQEKTKSPILWQIRNKRVRRHGRLIQDPVRKK